MVSPGSILPPAKPHVPGNFPELLNKNRYLLVDEQTIIAPHP
jgi:hypothetical protein